MENLKMPKYLKIVDAKYAGKHSIWLRFNDGAERTIDFNTTATLT
jgi:hypothetical protein